MHSENGQISNFEIFEKNVYETIKILTGTTGDIVCSERYKKKQIELHGNWKSFAGI